MSAPWYHSKEAADLIAACGVTPPVVVERTARYADAVDHWTHWSNRDKRVRDLKLIRQKVIGDDITAHFDQPTVDEMISKAVRFTERGPCGFIKDADEVVA